MAIPAERFYFIGRNFLWNKKSTSPAASCLQNQYLIMRPRGLEPRTNRLRVYCSTNWAKGAYPIFFYRITYRITGTTNIIPHSSTKVNYKIHFFLNSQRLYYSKIFFQPMAILAKHFCFIGRNFLWNKKAPAPQLSICKTSTLKCALGGSNPGQID